MVASLIKILDTAPAVKTPVYPRFSMYRNYFHDRMPGTLSTKAWLFEIPVISSEMYVCYALASGRIGQTLLMKEH